MQTFYEWAMDTTFSERIVARMDARLIRREAKKKGLTLRRRWVGSKGVWYFGRRKGMTNKEALKFLGISLRSTPRASRPPGSGA